MQTTDTARDFGLGATRHIVLFRFRADVPEIDRAEVSRRFHALADSTRGDGARYIVSIESGPQRSPEDAGQGWEVGFIVTFASIGDRNFYVGRPFVADDGDYDLEHDAFKEFVGPLLAEGGVAVFDFQPS